jgi:two-component system cell cycle sensor histidine kinase/response regulator CckA
VECFSKTKAFRIRLAKQPSKFTLQLLYFSRKRPLEQVSLDLNHTIEEVSAMLRRLIGENINLVLDLAPAVGRVEADASMMEQVLVNLTVNSRDAMPHGGKLTITTQVVEIVESDVRIPSLARAGRFVALRVQDTGCGISTENLPRIFEPFFTTKEAGKGTGLGLATVFGIAKQHEGWLEVSSTIGVGTCFSLFLPAAATNRSVAPTIESDAVRTPICGGAETILIVEDEASVREFAVAVLEPLGYRVLQARSGNEAIEVWKWHHKRISLLLTDMVLPDDLTGPELARQLSAAKPELRIIFTSGYSQETADQVFAAEKGARFINKPYSPRQLSSLVRKILDSNSVPRLSGRTIL